MAYGTEPFTDGYGDYKQPTIVDYDKKLAVNVPRSSASKEEAEATLKQFKRDQEEALAEILECNPYLGGEQYQHLVFSDNGKLVWDVTKINALKDDVDWLYSFSRYVRKRKKMISTT